MKYTDKQRLEWMQRHKLVSVSCLHGRWCVEIDPDFDLDWYGKTLRQALDKAMACGWTKREIRKAAFKKGKK